MIFIYVRVHTCKSMPTESRRGPQILYRSQPAQVSTGNQAGSGEEHQAFLTAEPLLFSSSSLHLFTHLFSLSQTFSLCEHACTYSWAYTDKRMASVNLFSFPPHESPRNQTQDVRLGRLKPSFRPRGCLTVRDCCVLFHDWLCTFYFPEDCCHWACCMVTETSEVSTFPLVF